MRRLAWKQLFILLASFILLMFMQYVKLLCSISKPGVYISATESRGDSVQLKLIVTVKT